MLLRNHLLSACKKRGRTLIQSAAPYQLSKPHLLPWALLSCGCNRSDSRHGEKDSPAVPEALTYTLTAAGSVPTDLPKSAAWNLVILCCLSTKLLCLHQVCLDPFPPRFLERSCLYGLYDPYHLVIFWLLLQRQVTPSPCRFHIGFRDIILRRLIGSCHQLMKCAPLWNWRVG